MAAKDWWQPRVLHRFRECYPVKLCLGAGTWGFFFSSFLFSPGENHWERCLGTEWKSRQKFYYIILHQIFSENQISSSWNVMTVDQVVGQLTVAHVWCSWHTDTHACLSEICILFSSSDKWYKIVCLMTETTTIHITKAITSTYQETHSVQ